MEIFCGQLALKLQKVFFTLYDSLKDRGELCCVVCVDTSVCLTLFTDLGKEKKNLKICREFG